MERLCPYCNYKFEAHESIKGETNPSDGDISFCIKCGQIGEFRKGNVIKMDFEKLTDNLKAEVKALSTAWLKLRENKKPHFTEFAEEF